MIYLLDTYTWIWWNMNPQKLSQRVKEIIVATAREENAIMLTQDKKILTYENVRNMW